MPVLAQVSPISSRSKTMERLVQYGVCLGSANHMRCLSRSFRHLEISWPGKTNWLQ